MVLPVSYFCLCCDKTSWPHPKSNLGNKGDYFSLKFEVTHSSSLWGGQGRNLKQSGRMHIRWERNECTRVFLLACTQLSFSILIQFRIPCLRNGAARQFQMQRHSPGSESGLSKKTKARGNVTDLSSLERCNNTFEHGALSWIPGQNEGWWRGGWVPQRDWSCYYSDSFFGFMSAKTHHVSNDDLELPMKQEHQEHRLEAHGPSNLCSKSNGTSETVPLARGRRGPTPERCLLAHSHLAPIISFEKRRNLRAFPLFPVLA